MIYICSVYKVQWSNKCAYERIQTWKDAYNNNNKKKTIRSFQSFRWSGETCVTVCMILFWALAVLPTKKGHHTVGRVFRLTSLVTFLKRVLNTFLIKLLWRRQRFYASCLSNDVWYEADCYKSRRRLWFPVFEDNAVLSLAFPLTMWCSCLVHGSALHIMLCHTRRKSIILYVGIL